jgi:hypothetical protein
LEIRSTEINGISRQSGGTHCLTWIPDTASDIHHPTIALPTNIKSYKKSNLVLQTHNKQHIPTIHRHSHNIKDIPFTKWILIYPSFNQFHWLCGHPPIPEGFYTLS